MRRLAHALGAPVRFLHRALCALLDPEGRRAWAVLIAWGCGVAMTLYASYALWLVRKNPMLVFWLGLGGLFIIFVVITAFTGLLVKRDIGGSFSREGGSFSIHDGGTTDGALGN